MSRTDVRQKLRGDGKYRILSLDGGGIRGALSAAVLAKIETSLREHYNCSDLVLADYFDVVGGTSTGSILAAGISIGKDMSFIQDIYQNKGKEIFAKKWYPNPFGLLTRYKERPLERLLQQVLDEDRSFQDLSFGSRDSNNVTCDLIVVAECITKEGLENPTFSTVFFTSLRNAGSAYESSKDVKIWQAYRASSAAPTYFKPFSMIYEQGSSKTPGQVNFIGAIIDRGSSLLGFSFLKQKLRENKADFIDGGISGFNNPENAILSALTSKV